MERNRDPSIGPEAKGQPSERERRLTPSEQPVIADGQLGGANLERGPERANPEGTVDTPNPRRRMR